MSDQRKREAPPLPAEAAQPPGKKHKSSKDQRSHKRKYFSAKTCSGPIPPGAKGFLVTCPTRKEPQCKADAIAILNEAAFQIQQDSGKSETCSGESVPVDAALAAELAELSAQKQEGICAFETGVKGLVFVKLPADYAVGPVALATFIAEDFMSQTEKKRLPHPGRFILRLLPVECTCTATMEALKTTAEALFKDKLSGQHKSYSVMYKCRHNDSFSKGDTIQAIAAVIPSTMVVNLNEPDYCVLVEIFHKICGISVVPGYNKLRRLNLHELCSKPKEKKVTTRESPQDVHEQK